MRTAIEKIVSLVALVAALLIVVATRAATRRRDISYHLSATDGTEQLTGTLVTDGAFGALSPPSILSWSLVATGHTALTLSSLDGGTLVDGG
jgi:hypothetical protein